jgi:arylsulfatase
MKNTGIQLLQRLQNSALLNVILFSIAGIAMTAIAQERPNIILMMADDMGFSDIGPYGGEVMTPNLDSLAAGGVRFTQFYNTGRCCPTRATLLTGLYAHQAGMGHMTSNNENSDGPGFSGGITSRCVTIAEVLKTAGYATYVSGKWHVVRNGNLTGNNKENWPPQRGFDRSFGIITGACNYYSALQNTTNTLAAGNTIINAHDNFYFTDDISDTTVKYIN